MVSNLPTYSGKGLGERIPRNIAMPMILAVVVFIAILLSYPWATLAAAACGYLLALPWGQNYHKRLQSEHAQGEMVRQSNATRLANEVISNGPAKTKPARKTSKNAKSSTIKKPS
jgi:CDP-diacylglycerol--serine O-phosphatidyltransferase